MTLFFNRKKSIKEHESFKILIENNKKKIYIIAYSILRDEQKAKDVVQETFIIAWKQLSQLKDKSKFHSWIKTIAANKAKDYYKKYQNEMLIIDNDNTYNLINKKVYLELPDDILEKKEFKRYLLLEINNLNSQYSEVIYLYYFAELSYEEISYHLDIPINTVGSRIYRAKKQLKENLQKNHYFNSNYNGSGESK